MIAWRIWNCKHDWIASRSICNKCHVGYSCKHGTARYTECSLENRSHKVASTIADATKKRKRVDINVKQSQEPLSKKACVDTSDIDINALIDGSGIVLY